MSLELGFEKDVFRRVVDKSSIDLQSCVGPLAS